MRHSAALTPADNEYLGSATPFPLSPGQSALWNAQHLTPDVPLSVAQYVHIRGSVDIGRLAEAFRLATIEMQSPMLRILPIAGVLHQVTDPAFIPDTELVDLRDELDPATAAMEWMQQDSRTPVDLSGPLTLSVVLRVGPAEHFWYTRTHHIALDGYGSIMLLSRIVQHYDAATFGTPAAVCNATDLSAIQQSETDYRTSANFLADQQYWNQHLAQLPGPFQLSIRPATPSARRWIEGGLIDSATFAYLETAKARYGAGRSAVLVAGLAAYFAAFTGRSEVLISLPVTARTTPSQRASAGFVSNVVPIHVRIDRTTTTQELVTQVDRTIRNALRHQRYRHEDIRRDLGEVGNQRGFFGPMVNLMLFYNTLTIGGVSASIHVLSTGPVEDLSVNVYNSVAESALQVDFEANPHRYSKTEVAAHLRRFLGYMERLVAADPDSLVSDIAAIDDAEHELVVDLWNSTGAPVVNAPLPDLFAEQVRRTPHAPAIVCGTLQLSYAELAARANRLARLLIRHGVGPESVVALAMPRSMDLVVSIYAVAATGAAYLPIDPDHPVDRIDHVLNTAAVACILTADCHLDFAQNIDRIDVRTEDVSSFASDEVRDHERTTPLRSEHPAYVIFTSGSTGRPKGVAVSQAAIVSRLHWMQCRYPLDSTDSVLLKTPATFDVSVWEFFWPLQIGARLVIAEPDGHRDPAYLVKVITEQQVTTAHFVPSMLSVFLESTTTPQHTVLRRIFASGEALSAPTVRAFGDRLPGVELHNLYGPTEAAIDVTAWNCERSADEVLIGRPVTNTQVYLLDAHLRPVPVGAVGEMYLGGIQLARGYVRLPGLTAERFIADPFSTQGGRLYRTGDLARWTHDGNLQYLGRTDFQVKVRGNRIELGEIEATLLAEPGVARAVCVARLADNGAIQLIAYVVANVNDAPSARHMRSVVARTLPDYMVPHRIVLLDELPLNTNGKIDRGALPEPTSDDAIAGTAPRNPSEQSVADAFDLVLGRQVGIEDNFFTLGGDSLLAMRVIARINAVDGAELSMRDLFEAPSVAELAGRLSNSVTRTGRPLLPTEDRPDPIPLSLAQQRLWFVNALDRTSSAYNVPLALRMSGDLDVEALRLSLLDLQERQQALRTCFPRSGSGPSQHVLPVALPEGLDPVEVTEDELLACLVEFADNGFDLAVDRPLRTRLFRTDSSEYTLAIVVHHIACDGWSLRLLARDLATAYTARRQHRAPHWPELPVDYADFAVWQHTILGDEDNRTEVARSQLAYWTAKLADLPAQLDLPTDRARPRTPSHRGGTHAFVIDAETRCCITDLAHRQGVSIFMILHGALAIVLARSASSDDIAIGTPVAGRDDPALDDVVGMFVNTLVLRVTVDLHDTFEILLRRIRDNDLGAFTHADVPFEWVVDAANPERSPARHPLFQVMLSYERAADIDVRLPGLTVSAAAIETGMSKMDLQLTITDDAESDTMHAEFGYALDLFDPSTIEMMATRLESILRAASRHPDLPVGDLPLLNRWERDLLCPITSSTTTVTTGLLPDLLTNAARPDAVAVRYRGSTLTYRELDEQSNQLARILIASDLGPEDIVALSLPRSVDFVVAIWAVAKSGAAYLPIDPGLPQTRIAAMIADANVLTGLTTSAHVGQLPVSLSWWLLDSDELLDQMRIASSAPIDATERVRPLRPAHPAYLIYTSGSTGTPKAVIVTHLGLASLAHEMIDRFEVSTAARTLHFSAPSFDASVLELLLAFVAGATMVIAPPTIYGGGELEQLLRRERVTHAFVTPAALATIAHTDLAELRVVIVGGDDSGPELINAWAPDRNMFNAYGPSEITVAATISAPLRENEPVSIGGPIRGTRLLVLDHRLKPVPVGVPGELYIAGPGLARGYHNRTGLTATRFVVDPYGLPGERMYRTGDLVTVSADATLRFHGRADDQVKLRGYRIELREIDAALSAHPSVTFARTVVHHDAAGVARLAAYVCGTPPLSAIELIAGVRATLPSYMVPAAVIVLDRIPTTRSGKLDRAALPDPEFTTATPTRSPRSASEQRLADLFGQILGRDGIGIDDSFFELGGTSLLATRLATAIAAAFDAEVEVRSIFEAPTVAELADVIASTASANLSPLTARHRPGRIPAAPAQRRLWFLNRLDTESTAYHIAFAVRMSGAVDVVAMRAALGDIVERHEVLRTILPEDEDGPAQQILPPERARLEIPIIDVADADIEEQLRRFASIRFDLTTQLPLRAELLRVSDRQYVLGIVLHHIAADGWSMTPLTADLLAAYRARCAGTAPMWQPLTVQYADYTLWQYDRLGDERSPSSLGAAELTFWTHTLAELPDETPLPFDHPRPNSGGAPAAVLAVEVPATTVAGLQQLTRKQGVSLFMTLHAALAVLLRHITGTDDITIGTPIAGRHDRSLDNLVGMFANTLALRTKVEAGASFAEFLRATTEADLAAMAHADVPFDRVVEAVNPIRSGDRHPLFQVALIVQERHTPAPAIPGLLCSVAAIDAQIAKFDLELRVNATAGSQLDFEFLYSSSLFDQGTMAELATRLSRVLTAVATQPDIVIADIDVLTTAERENLVPAKGIPAQNPITLPDYLDAAIHRGGDRPALISPTGHLSYRTLDSRANRIAHALIRRGIGPDDLVAVGIPRSIESVVATLAVIRTGAGFLPVDVGYPLDRIRHVLNDSGARFGITTTESSALPDDVEWVSITDLDDDSRPVRPEDRLRPIYPADLAYVIYTSGSTGLPKGVAVTHAGLSNFGAEQRDRYQIDFASRTLHFASPSFDASVLELLLAFPACATMVIAPSDVYGGDELAELLRDSEVTHAFITPAALATIDPISHQLPALRCLIVGGEACGTELVERWGPDRFLFNGYGPTETTIMAAISAPLRPGAPIPIGGPVRGVRAVVLDGRLRPVPIGVPGELYLGGPGLARGYIRKPGLTAQRFIADPFDTGARLYRTGDIVRWTHDAELIFIGRADDQIKIRGFRIELGEINSACGSAEGVRFAHTEVHRDEQGSARLVTYVVVNDRDRFDERAIRDTAAGILPPHMVPAAVLRIDRVPRTATGKLDRKALPHPIFAADVPSRAARTPNEQLVVAIMTEVTGANLGAEDSFFDMGGNSLLATKVVSRIASTLGRRLTVRTVFEHPTPAQLATILDAEDPDRETERPALIRMERPDRVPLSFAQQRLWLLNRLEVNSALYNIPLGLRLDGPLQEAALRQAVLDVRQRHEVLRTVYPDSPDGPYQQVLISADCELHRYAVVDDRDAARRVADFARQGFDLTTAGPMRVYLLQITKERHLLAVVVHHIAIDGWSLAVLASDLLTAYVARISGDAPEWDELPLQYSDYALWQRDWLTDGTDPASPLGQQLGYWREKLADLPEQIELPVDRPRTTAPSHRGGSISVSMGADVHVRLLRLASEHDASLFMVVHTALAVLLHRLSGTDDIAIGTPVAGRTDRKLDSLIGMFVNTLVLRTRITGTESFDQLLVGVRADDLDAFAHSEVPFDRLVEMLNPRRASTHHPLFQVMLSLHDFAPEPATLRGLDVSPVELDAGVAKFDLQFTVSESYTSGRVPTGMNISVNYAQDLFDEATATQIGDRFARVLVAAAESPATAIGDIELLDSQEFAALAPVRGANSDVARSFSALFAAAVAVAPDGIALRFRGQDVTYRALDRRSNQLARILIHHGVGAETLVALGIPRSIEWICALLAVTKAGGAFVPVDPDYPAARKEHMVTDSGARLGLTVSAALSELPEPLRWIVLDDPDFIAQLDSAQSGSITDEELHFRRRLDHPAYMVYTSGSTGAPKGVTVTHTGLSHFADETAQRFGVEPSCRILHFATPSFDAAILDVLFAFGGAATLVITPPGIYGGDELTALLETERITHAFITTAAVATADPSRAPHLRHLLVGGEACPPELVRRWAGAPLSADPVEGPNVVRHMYNVYGPTETTIVTTMGSPLVPGEPITIGGPIRGTRAMVLDARLQPVPVGVTGELYLAGPAVARGYHRRPVLTSERFVADPFGAPGDRMYRTGDRVRWSMRSAQPEIEFVGRSDNQVKIRGYRIEPGEIDAVLGTHPAVDYAVTVAHRMPNDTVVLAAYVVADTAPSCSPYQLREYASVRLPSYMVPQAITLLDTVPLTPVGKLDRNALPTPDFGARTERIAPTTAAQAAICAAFETVLELEFVNASDSFFELGGNSLLATRVVAIIREQLGVDLPMQALFGNPTPAGVAAAIETDAGSKPNTTDSALRIVLPLRPEGNRRPLYCVHPAIGLSWSYSGLVPYLDPQRPLFGLQSPLLSGSNPVNSVEELAAVYVSEVLQIQPEGPYYLLGWSLGGLIAHEMAVQLTMAGKEVALLAMLDSYVLSRPEHRSELAETTDMTGLLAEYSSQVGLPEHVSTLEEAADALRSHTGPFGSLDYSDLERLRDCYLAGAELAAHFEPGRYDGDLLFFTASTDIGNGRRQTIGLVDEWRAYIGGDIDNHEVPYPHTALTTPEALAVIGPVLREYLDPQV
ncbi:amino acid adenylation domain-containing protein [Nocardia brasiliensis]